MQINELTNETLNLKNSLNKTKNQIDLIENQHRLHIAEQEASLRAKIYEVESQGNEKQRKEMESLRSELMNNVEKIRQAKEETEEELYKVK